MMIVSCESCGTKFRLNPELLRGRGSKVRCSRCGAVFDVELEEPGEVVGFAPDTRDEDLLAGPDTRDKEEDEGGEGPVSGIESPGPQAASTSRKKLSIRRILAALLLVLAVGGGVYLVSFLLPNTSPPESRGKVSPKAPEQLSVTVKDTLNAYFLQNTQAGQLFVVEGEVANESKQSVSFILLEGRLYTTDNQTAQSQRCYSGNIMTREELSSLSAPEIQNRMMNREGNNLKNVHVPASGKVPFMLVFHNLPELKTLGDYSVEVISAKMD